MIYFSIMTSAYHNSDLPSLRQPIKCLSPEEINALLDFTREKSSFYCPRWQRPRNELIVLLMLDAGLRVGELVQLTRLDLWIDSSPVHALLLRAAITKTKKERYIPLTGRCQKAITDCQSRYWLFDWGENQTWAFHGRRHGQHITTRQVGRLINSVSSKAIKRTINPHMLRHTFATRLMRTTSAPVVQALLGHTNLSSTQIYTHPSESDLREAIMGL